jgi:hypothetical protein
MMVTLADSMLPVMTHIDKQLISAPAIEYLTAAGSLFPDALSTTVGFELRMGRRDSAADLALRVTGDEGGRAILADCHPTIRLPERMRDDPVWARIRDFCTVWADESSSLYSRVMNVWLELEHDRPLLPAPVPGVFCGLYEQDRAGDGSWLCERALPLLRGKPFTPPMRRRLHSAFVALATGPRIFQAGMLLGRSIDAVRLLCWPKSQPA